MTLGTYLWDYLDYAIVYGLRILFVLLFLMFGIALIATLYDYKPRKPNRRKPGVLPAPSKNCIRDPYRERFL